MKKTVVLILSLILNIVLIILLVLNVLAPKKDEIKEALTSESKYMGHWVSDDPRFSDLFVEANGEIVVANVVSKKATTDDPYEAYIKYVLRGRLEDGAIVIDKVFTSEYDGSAVQRIQIREDDYDEFPEEVMPTVYHNLDSIPESEYQAKSIGYVFNSVSDSMIQVTLFEGPNGNITFIKNNE